MKVQCTSKAFSERLKVREGAAKVQSARIACGSHFVKVQCASGEGAVRHCAVGARKVALGGHKVALGARMIALGGHQIALGAHLIAPGAHRVPLGAHLVALVANIGARCVLACVKCDLVGAK